MLDYFIKNNRVNPKFLCHDSNDDIRRKYGKPVRFSHYLAEIKVPYPMVLAWNTKAGVTRIRCHKQVAKPLANALSEIKHHPDMIKTLGLNLYAGCHNYRKIRGGIHLSSHSWGISIDINSSGNPFRCQPKSTTLGKHPELALQFANIMLKHGFKTLEYDLMHWQYTL
jgi:hypothetical protein